MIKRNGFTNNLTIVKRVSGDETSYDYHLNERVAQSWVDTFNIGNRSGHAMIVDSEKAPRSTNCDDTVRT